MEIMDRSLKTLATSLNLRQLRQELIATNIANSETPGYKAKRLDFEEALARAIDIDGQMDMKVEKKDHFNVGSGGFKNLQPEINVDPNGVVNEDGNTVDRDKEMALMAKNKILYDASIQLLNKKLGLLRYAITSER